MTDMATAALPIDLGRGPFAVTTRGLAKRFGSVRALDDRRTTGSATPG